MEGRDTAGRRSQDDDYAVTFTLQLVKQDPSNLPPPAFMVRSNDVIAHCPLQLGGAQRRNSLDPGEKEPLPVCSGDVLLTAQR